MIYTFFYFILGQFKIEPIKKKSGDLNALLHNDLHFYEQFSNGVVSTNERLI